MKLYIFIIISVICSFQMLFGQSNDGVVALDLPVRNSLIFNRFAINPTFTFVRQQNKFFSISNEREWVQFENSPETYLASYSGRFSENTGAGIALFQQNYGVLTTFGGLLNYAYNVQLSADSNLTFGLNVGAYKSGINTGNVVTNFDDPSLQNIPSNFLLTVNPGINYGTEFFDFGVSVNNLVQYNFETSSMLEDNRKRGIQAHVMRTGYFDGRGFFSRAKFSTILKSEFREDETIVSGLVSLIVPKGIWFQVGYNNVYGVSGGLGVNLTSQIALEYNIEKSIGELVEFGSSHNFTLAYRFITEKEYKYSGDDEVSGLFSRKNPKKPLTEESIAERESIRERAEERRIKAKLEAEAKAEAKLAAEQKAEQEKEEAKAKKIADKKAKAEADAKAKIEAKQNAKAKQEAEKKAKEIADKRAEILAKQKADEKAKALADQKAKKAAELEAKKIADAKAKLLAEQKAKQLAEQKAIEVAEAKAKLELELEQKVKAEAQAKLLADQKAKEENEARAKRLAEQKAKAEADAKAAKQRDKQNAQKEADAKKAKQLSEQKATEAKSEAETKANNELISNPKDALGKSLAEAAKITEAARVKQAKLLKDLDAIINVKDNDLKDLKEENDLSDKGIAVEPKEFKSVTAENNALRAIKSDLDNVIKTRTEKIEELSALYDERTKISTYTMDPVDIHYKKEIKRLKSEQLKAIETKIELESKLEVIKKATEFERRRRIKRAAFDNEEDRYSQDRATLLNIKQTTRLSEVPLTKDDFNFGEDQGSSIKILKNIKNVENGYYMIIAVHGDRAKRDDFVTKVVASGRSDVNFFHDVNTSKYYIYYEKFDNIQNANNALQNKGNRPYNVKMSIVKIEN